METRNFGDRLAAIETLVIARPDAVSVKTLEERVKLGKEATEELHKTLLPWGDAEADQKWPRFRRKSACGRYDALLFVAAGINAKHYSLICDHYAPNKVACVIALDPSDVEEVKRRADLILGIADYRLESATPSEAA